MRAFELYEAINISDYQTKIWNKLQPHLNDWHEYVEHADKQSIPWVDMGMTIAHDLNEILDEEYINFESEFSNEVSDDYVAHASINTETGFITITLDASSIEGGEYSLLDRSELWLKSLVMTITHELLHREQLLRSKVHLKGTDNMNIHTMLSNKHEIQAYAKDAIDQLLRYSSVNTKDDILKILRTDDSRFDSEAIQRYYKEFVEYNDDLNDKRTWQRFMKYVYYYANQIKD